MALQKCYECKKKVSTAAANCPNCGAPVIIQPKAKPYGCLTLIVLIFIAIFLANHYEKERWNSLTPEEQKQEIKQKAQEEKIRLQKEKQEAKRKAQKDFKTRCDKNDRLAFVMVQNAVRSRLKSPSSAEFPVLESKTVEYKVKGSTDCYYTVRGVVDAQNSFGAMLRRTFMAQITYFYKTGAWRVTSVEVGY